MRRDTLRYTASNRQNRSDPLVGQRRNIKEEIQMRTAGHRVTTSARSLPQHDSNAILRQKEGSVSNKKFFATSGNECYSASNSTSSNPQTNPIDSQTEHPSSGHSRYPKGHGPGAAASESYGGTRISSRTVALLVGAGGLEVVFHSVPAFGAAYGASAKSGTVRRSGGTLPEIKSQIPPIDDETRYGRGGK